jgi:POT family proton-dependent oligopeptide transporter
MSPVTDIPDVQSGVLIDRASERLEPVYNEKHDEVGLDEKYPSQSEPANSDTTDLVDGNPSEEELHGPNALRRVSAPIPWAVYTVAFVELCERFSYYGTQVVCMFFLPKILETKQAAQMGPMLIHPRL